MSELGEWLDRPIGKKNTTRKEFDPSQPRNENGQWSETGAGGSRSGRSGGDVIVHHGTSSKFINNIKKRGLLGSKAGTGQGWQPTTNDKGHVFFSQDRKTAEYWASNTIENHGGKSAILKVRIPKSEISKISKDPDAFGKGALRFKGDIPPSWIVSIEEGKGW